ncbi:MAG TPA: methylglyoxal synthase [Opitutaceae bacterium]|nr:methylglyoxal synthase [Opitutaceae bacterium]
MEKPAPASSPYVALIAHDAKKEVMVSFAEQHREFLRSQRLVATRTTGTLIAGRTGLSVEAMLSGPLGGDLQIGALIATGQVRAVVFLRDPLTAHPHEPDIAALMKVCDVYDVPLATNLATAHVLVNHLAAQGQTS